jgi:hypothetical protein
MFPRPNNNASVMRNSVSSVANPDIDLLNATRVGRAQIKERKQPKWPRRNRKTSRV